MDEKMASSLTSACLDLGLDLGTAGLDYKTAS